MPPPDSGPDAKPRWAFPVIDRHEIERALRFTVSVMAPVLFTAATGPQPWLVYAMVAATVSFVGDSGGPPMARLGWMAVGPAALALGLALGTLSLGHLPVVVALAMGAGLAYGLVETAHPHLLLATRFFAFGIALAGLVNTPDASDYVAIGSMYLFSWALSIAADLVRGRWTPLTAPPFSALLPSLSRNWRDRWTFGAAVSLAIGLALLATVPFGSLRPSWACLTILVVMRSEILGSLRAAAERVAGTIAGVLAAAVITHFGGPWLTLLAMALAAFVRWPAQQRHNALGVFCLTVFILLMVELATPDLHQAAILLRERFYDTLIGAIAAGVGLLVYRLLRGSGAKSERDDAAAPRTRPED